MALVDIALMSFFLILFLIWVSGFGSKPRKHKSKRTLRCICVLLGVGSNLEYHITLEGWNSLLLLSFLAVFTTRAEAQDTQNLIELQIALKNMTPLLNVSTASLYAPLPNTDNCTRKLMYCYLLELNVILHEEEYEAKEDDLNLIHTLKKRYNSSNSCSMCSACEAHPLTNFTTFYERMERFLVQLNSKQGTKTYEVCD